MFRVELDREIVTSEWYQTIYIVDGDAVEDLREMLEGEGFDWHDVAWVAQEVR